MIILPKRNLRAHNFKPLNHKIKLIILKLNYQQANLSLKQTIKSHQTSQYPILANTTNSSQLNNFINPQLHSRSRHLISVPHQKQKFRATLKQHL
jgi:hypothetical protein